MPVPGNEYLVSYDVACRWRRVFRLLQGYGERVRLSMFRCRLDSRRSTRMESELRDIVDSAEDRLFITRVDEDELSDSGTVDAASRKTERALVL